MRLSKSSEYNLQSGKAHQGGEKSAAGPPGKNHVQDGDERGMTYKQNAQGPEWETGNSASFRGLQFKMTGNRQQNRIATYTQKIFVAVRTEPTWASESNGQRSKEEEEMEMEKEVKKRKTRENRASSQG